jgi:hypothetical protein
MWPRKETSERALLIRFAGAGQCAVFIQRHNRVDGRVLVPDSFQ